MAACGGGGGGGDIPTQTTASNTKPKPILIEEYGDSTTAGWQVINGVGANTKASEPVYLQTLLQAKFGSTVTVSNQGVGGTEASQLLNGTDGIHPAWANQMAQSKAQIVTLNFAFNDAYYDVVATPGIQAESVQDYLTIMTQLVQIAVAAGKKVVIYTPNPTCEPNRASVLANYVQALEAVASTQNVPIADDYGAMLQTDWRSMLTDCLHPTDAGYLVKAQLEFPAVSSAVQSALQ